MTLGLNLESKRVDSQIAQIAKTAHTRQTWRSRPVPVRCAMPINAMKAMITHYGDTKSGSL